MKKGTLPTVKYKDFYFRLIGALLTAHFIVVFGIEEKFFDLLLDINYYRSVAYSFVIAFILINLVYFATARLDRQFDWKQAPLQRTALQVFFALVAPGVFAYLLAFIYFRIHGMNITETPYLQYDFPVIVLMLVLLNAYYVAYYFYLQWRMAEKTVNGQTETNSLDNVSVEETAKNVFIVQRGAKNIPLSVTDIAYFYREGDYNYLKTFDEESYLVSQTLDEVEAQLDNKIFFRANRQMIVQYKACKHFTPLQFGKLELFVSPPAKDSIVISQRRAKSFKEWVER